MIASRCVAHRPFVSIKSFRPRKERAILVRLTSNDIKNGMTIDIDGTPWRVIEFLHVKPGKGSAFVRSKIRNLRSGQTVEKTFRAGEPLTAAEVYKQECQFTYTEGDTYVFMNMDSYEEVRIQKDDEWAKYLTEGADCDVVFFGEDVISVEPPKIMTVKVIQSDPAVKGDTSGSAMKPAILEVGGEIQVPLFIEVGDVIRVDTREGKYLGKA